MKILLPALSPTMETGNLVKWLVEEGDSVVSGDILAEIETDKATMELESPDDGKVEKILVKEGTENISVNTEIALLKVDGEETEEIPVKSVEKSLCPHLSQPATSFLNPVYLTPVLVTVLVALTCD